MIPNWLKAFIWAILLAGLFRTFLIAFVSFMQWTE
jgi:hypothetical protein